MYRTLLATCGSEKMLTQTVYSPRTTNSHKLQSHTLQATCGTLLSNEYKLLTHTLQARCGTFTLLLLSNENKHLTFTLLLLSNEYKHYSHVGKILFGMQCGHLQKQRQGVNKKNVVPLQRIDGHWAASVPYCFAPCPPRYAPAKSRKSHLYIYGQQTTLHDARRQRYERGRTQRHQEH